VGHLHVKPCEVGAPWLVCGAWPRAEQVDYCTVHILLVNPFLVAPSWGSALRASMAWPLVLSRIGSTSCMLLSTAESLEGWGFVLDGTAPHQASRISQHPHLQRAIRGMVVFHPGY
jgi:hypothetical protein